MRGYEISSLSAKTQELIQKEGLDTNNDGLINEENGELKNLLSRTGKSDVKELCYDNLLEAKTWDLILGSGFALGGFTLLRETRDFKTSISIDTLKRHARELFTKYNGITPSLQSADIPYTPPKLAKPLIEDDTYKWFKSMGEDKKAEEWLSALSKKEKEAIERYNARYQQQIEEINSSNQRAKAWKPKVSMKQCLQKAANRQKLLALLVKCPIKSLYGLGSVIAFGAAAWLFTQKPSEGVAKWTGNDNYTPVEREQSVFEGQFREVFGEEAELKEYIPQRGEYWISILKAKYGVDDNTAQEMARRIKKVIYEDSLAAKQSPVMYLPQTWTFKGKTYQYNDSTEADRTENFDNDVKTEMGKMHINIEY